MKHFEKMILNKKSDLLSQMKKNVENIILAKEISFTCFHRKCRKIILDKQNNFIDEKKNIEKVVLFLQMEKT